MTAWSVRQAQLGDAAAIVRIEGAAFGAASWGGSAVADGLTAPHVAALVAFGAEAAPSGFAFWRKLDDEAEILSIAVEPAAQRRGCARALLSAICSAARAAGIRRLFLEVDEGNAAASALYRAAGFETIGRRARYYRSGGDALVMRLNL